MIDLSLSRASAGLLGAKLEAHCSEEALQTGLALFKTNSVTHIWKDQFNIIHAFVRNKTGGDSKLQIDLDFFAASECSCDSQEKYCGHMAAVYFVLLQPHAEAEAWLADIKHGHSFPDARTAESAASSDPSGAFGDAHKHADPQTWRTWLHKELDVLYRRQTDLRRIDIFYYNAMKKLSALAEPLPPDCRAYFRMYCALLLLTHAEQHLTVYRRDYAQSYYHRVVADLHRHFMGRLQDEMQQIGHAEEDERSLPYFHAIRTLLDQAMPPTGNTAFNWSEAHRLVWTGLLQDPSWRKQEIERLMEMYARRDPGEAERADSLLQSAAHLEWLLGCDDAAMKKLSDMHHIDSGLIVTYLETHAQTRSWQRLGHWLHFALPCLRRASSETLGKALSIWRMYARHTGDEASFRQALSALLPRSYASYSEYLIKSGRYEEWSHFHLLNGIPPSKIDWGQLKEAEQKAPRLVLPIYHHAIERLIASRNRGAYREMAKLAKRLRELYHDIGAPERFRTFINELIDRNQRLHALMEELEKGKLLR